METKTHKLTDGTTVFAHSSDVKSFVGVTSSAPEEMAVEQRHTRIKLLSDEIYSLYAKIDTKKA